MKNFINISDHSSNDLRAIIDEAKIRKLKRKNSNKLSISIKNFKNLKYKEFFKNYENYLNLIHYTKIIKFIG